MVRDVHVLAELAQKGSLKPSASATTAEQAAASSYTFADAVRHYRATHMRTSLKPSTRRSYDKWLDTVLVPRFGERRLTEVTGKELALLDAELVEDELADSTRSNIHSIFRSVLRNAARGLRWTDVDLQARTLTLPRPDRLRLVEQLSEELGSELLQEAPLEAPSGSRLVLKNGFHVFTGPVEQAELDHRIDRGEHLAHLSRFAGASRD